MAFNGTKRELLSFNRHRDPLLVPVEMNVIELPEETSFCLVDLAFYLVNGMETTYSPLPRLLQGKWAGSLYRAQRFLTPESFLYLHKSTIWRCMEYCSHILSGVVFQGPMSLIC